MSLDLKEQYEKIYTFCYFKVHNREIAEDIAQETFLKYFETTSYLEKGKKLAFLYTIARNCCIDYYRKTKITISINELSKLSIEDEFNIEASIAVQSAVAKLNTEEQEIILLRFTNELSIVEIAEYLGLSRFCVHRKLKAIEQKLKTILRKEDFYG